ncbi:MAG TPA: hypothetical protein DEP72_08185 [Clostridiales bacterium]|nr:MAG: hypothetical protein A2Y18_03470 [Clostridiales bacterium GWD2_32_19]HCC08115.1 hypothetical protein [Clostridiales bacterium]
MKYHFDNIDRIAIKVSIYVVLSFTIIYILSSIVNVIPDFLMVILNTILYVLGILKPLWIALIIAYLLYPVSVWIKKMLFKEIIKRPHKKTQKVENIKKNEKFKTLISVFVTYILILSIITAVIIMGFVMIKGKLETTNLDSLISGTKNYMDETRIFLESNLKARLDASHLLSSDLKDKVTEFVQGIGNIGQVIFDFIINLFTGIMDNLLSFLLALVIAFYIMVDLEFFEKIYKEGQRLILPKKHCDRINKFLSEVDGVVSKFIRGQLLDCSIIAGVSIIALSLVGLDYAFFVGLFVGLSNIIPYFGPIIGVIPAVIIGLLSTEPITALYALIVLGIIQQLDGNIMAPRIVGQSVGLHPVFILLAVITGAQFGLVGMILAVPTAGVLRLVILKIVAAKKRKIENKA